MQKSLFYGLFAVAMLCGYAYGADDQEPSLLWRGLTSVPSFLSGTTATCALASLQPILTRLPTTAAKVVSAVNPHMNFAAAIFGFYQLYNEYQIVKLKLSTQVGRSKDQVPTVGEIFLPMLFRSVVKVLPSMILTTGILLAYGKLAKTK